MGRGGLSRRGTMTDQAPSIAGYQFEAELGRGGFATVWRARLGGVTVAVKIAHPGLEESLRSEADLVRSLQGHPGVVQFVDAGDLADGRPYLTVEYLGGGSLDERLGAWSEWQAISTGIAIAAVLQSLHARGLTHRDVN